MKYLASIIFLLFALTSDAQTIINSVKLTPVKKLKHIKQLPFDSVVVFDNRFDKRISVNGDGINPLWIRTLDSTAIKTYIKTVISGLPKQNNTLYISIKQLRFENVYSMTLFFSADAYFRDKDGFKKVATLKKPFYTKASFHRSYFQQGVMTALNELIKQVALSGIQPNSDDKNYTLNEINSTVTKDWINFPIMEQAIFPVNGVYGSVEDLKNNNITPADLILKQEADSSYSLTFGSIDKKNRSKFYNVYAICYSGKLYVKLLGYYYLPIEKMGDRLGFHVPVTMPNMSAIYIAEASGSDDFTFSTGGTNDVRVAFALIVVEGIFASIAESRNQKVREGIRERSLTETGMRSCFLDFDTGDIIY